MLARSSSALLAGAPVALPPNGIHELLVRCLPHGLELLLARLKAKEPLGLSHALTGGEEERSRRRVRHVVMAARWVVDCVAPRAREAISS